MIVTPGKDDIWMWWLKDVSYKYAKNEPGMKKKDAILNDLSTDLSGELYKINTDDKIPNNYRYTLTTIQAAQNQKQTQEI